MLETSTQGIVSVTGTTFVVVPKKTISKIASMRFHNAAAYTLTLTKYSAKLATTITVYALTLSAGDTVTDNMIYLLEEGDYMTIASSIAGTSYLITGITYPIV